MILPLSRTPHLLRTMVLTMAGITAIGCGSSRDDARQSGTKQASTTVEVTRVVAPGGEAVGRIEGSTLYRATLLPVGYSGERDQRELPFTLEVFDSGRRGRIWNGSERIEIPEVNVTSDSMVLRFPHYDSAIAARPMGKDGFEGTWIKNRGDRPRTHMSFRAVASERAYRFGLNRAEQENMFFPAPAPFPSGRFAVTFSQSDAPAVATIQSIAPELVGESHQPVQATFLTTLGDYRYLAGNVNATNHFQASCFDGAHAFLFRAKIDAKDGVRRMAGDFWSSDTWHETWTAVEDDEASLPDAFDLTTWNQGVQLDGLRFPLVNDQGVTEPMPPTALVDQGQGLVLHLFGTWCPNCGDAAADLAKLAPQWQRDHNVTVVGLAFEHAQEPTEAATRIRTHKAHHGADFPVLLAGLSDKAKASAAFPALDKVRAYPTTIFISAQGEVTAVHTGWSGPATGAAGQQMLQRFGELVGKLAPR